MYISYVGREAERRAGDNRRDEQMASYKVKMVATVTVEAENEDEAIGLAWEKAMEETSEVVKATATKVA